jgi:YD repeat-containing protein
MKNAFGAAAGLSFKPFLRFTLATAIAAVGVVGANADAPPAVTSIRYTGTDFEGRQGFVLEWDAAPNTIYHLQRRSGFESNTAWETFDIVVPDGNVGSYRHHGEAAEAAGGQIRREFLRVLMPQTAIFGIEPAVVANSGENIYIRGQCFPSNAVVYIDGVRQTNTTWIDSATLQVQVTFTPPPPGQIAPPRPVRVETAEGVLLAELPEGLICGSGWPVSQRLLEVPAEPPASPAALKVKEKGNRTKCTSRTIPSTGEIQLQEMDLWVPSRGIDFQWTRTYRSRTGANTVMGQGWSHSYDIRAIRSSNTMVVLDGTGRRDTYFLNPDATCTANELFNVGVFTNSLFWLVFPDGGYWEFSYPIEGDPDTGKLLQIVDRFGNAMRMSYDGSGRLSTIRDTMGRTNTVAYDLFGRILSVTDFSGRSVVYSYYRNGDAGGGNGDLKSVRSPTVTGTPNTNDFPLGKTTTYTYTTGFGDPALNHNLLTITDPLGQTWFRAEYHPTIDIADVGFDRVRSILRGQPGGPRTFLSYTRQVPAASNRWAVIKTIVNDPLGNVTVDWFDSLNRGIVHRDLAARAQPDTLVTETNLPDVKLRDTDPDYWETQYEWNQDSLCKRVTFPRGNSTEFLYQRAFNQNDSRSNRSRHSDGNPRVIRERACCGGADVDRDGDIDVTELVWQMEYDPRFGSPAMLCSAGQSWTFPSGPRQSTSLDSSRATGENTPIIKGSKAWDGILNSGLARRLNSKPQDSYQPWEVDDDEAIVSNPLYEQSGNSGENPLFEKSGFVVRATDARGNTDTAQYNEKGVPVVLAHEGRLLDGSDSPETSLEYDPVTGQLRAFVCSEANNSFQRRDLFDYSPDTGLLRTWIVDAQGPTIRIASFAHDARGNVTETVDGRGNTNRFIYNQLDQCVRAIEAPVCNPCPGVTTDMFYDADDNLFEVLRERRDKDGVINPKDPAWRVFRLYDLLKRTTLIAHEITHTIQQRFTTNRFTYDANDAVIEVFSPEAMNGHQPGNVTTFDYDTRGLLWRKTSGPGTPDQSTDEFDYDENGHLSRATCGGGGGSGGVVWLRTYDGFDRCITVTDPMGNLTWLAYDNNHNLIHERVEGETLDVPGDKNNQRMAQTRYEYDSLDRRVRTRHAFFDIPTQLPLLDGESTITFAYAPNGACSSVTDDKGNVTRYSYDTRGRLASIADPKTNTVSYLYDADDNVISVTQSDASDVSPARQMFTMNYQYDAMDRCTLDYDNVGNTNRYFYDSGHNLTLQIDPRGKARGWQYDGLSRAIIIEADLDGDGDYEPLVDSIMRQTWDDNSRLTQVIDGNSNATRYAYDALNRRIATTNPDTTVESLVWSPRSNLSSRTDPNGTMTQFTYDDANRCIRKDIVPGAGVASTTTFEDFAYDGMSRCVQASNNAALASFRYDSMGNCAHHSLLSMDVIVIHDENQRRTQLTYPSRRIVNYTYNALNEVTGVSSSPGDGLPAVNLATFAYEGPERPARMARGNGVNTRFTWNGMQNPANAPGDFGWQQVSLINHQIAGGGATIDRRAAAFDRNQNKILRQQLAPFPTGVPALTTNIFAYDALNRMTSYSRNRASTAHTKTMELDSNGNRRSFSSNGVVSAYTMDNGTPEPADFQMDQYTGTPFGIERHDLNGNLVAVDTAFGSTQFTYDYADRIVAVERTVGPALAPVVSFAYDALGRRVSKTTFPPAPSLPIVTQFMLDPETGEILEERENSTLKKTVVLPHMLEVSGRIMFSAGGQIYYSHVDELGSALALTDDKGGVMERYDYDEYGGPRFLTPEGVPMVNGDGTPTVSSPLGNDLLFGGMFWDGETELYLLRHNPTASDPFPDPPNYMNPRTGRVLSRAGGAPQTGRSAFTFAGDNPWSSKIDAKKQKQWLPANFRLGGGGGAGGGGGGGTLRLGGGKQDVYVWKLCSCGKKGCPRCPQKSSSGGGGGAGGSGLKVMFNPKEYTIEKATPWKTKKEEGGRHTPFHNKYRPEARKIEVMFNPKEYTITKVKPPRCFGAGQPHPQSCDRSIGEGAFGKVYPSMRSTITGVEMFRKILDYGEAGDNAGVLLRRDKGGTVCCTSSHL